jgi:hypothetical protein
MYRLEYLSSLGIKRFFRVREWYTLSKYDLTPITLSIPISYLNPGSRWTEKAAQIFNCPNSRQTLDFGIMSAVFSVYIEPSSQLLFLTPITPQIKRILPLLL